MKSDIQIAQEAKMEPIKNIAEKMGLSEDDIEYYGKYKCKISLDVYDKVKDNKDGKSNEDLPKAGEKSSIVFMITLLIVVSIIMLRRSRNLKIK